MPTIQGGQVGPIGFGLMGLTWRPDLPTQAESFALLSAAFAHGTTLGILDPRGKVMSYRGQSTSLRRPVAL